MSNRVIRVGVMFEFYPDGEHEDLFEGMTEEQTISNAKSMTSDDIDRLVKYNEVWDALQVEVLTKKQ